MRRDRSERANSIQRQFGGPIAMMTPDFDPEIRAQVTDLSKCSANAVFSKGAHNRIDLFTDAGEAACRRVLQERPDIANRLGILMGGPEREHHHAWSIAARLVILPPHEQDQVIGAVQAAYEEELAASGPRF